MNPSSFNVFNINTNDYSKTPSVKEQIEEASRNAKQDRYDSLKDINENIGLEENAPDKPFDNWGDYQRNTARDQIDNNNGAIFNSLEDTNQAIEENNRTINDFKVELKQKYQELAQLKQDLANAQQDLANAQAMPCDYTPCE